MTKDEEKLRSILHSILNVLDGMMFAKAVQYRQKKEKPLIILGELPPPRMEVFSDRYIKK